MSRLPNRPPAEISSKLSSCCRPGSSRWRENSKHASLQGPIRRHKHAIKKIYNRHFGAEMNLNTSGLLKSNNMTQENHSKYIWVNTHEHPNNQRGLTQHFTTRDSQTARADSDWHITWRALTQQPFFLHSPRQRRHAAKWPVNENQRQDRGKCKRGWMNFPKIDWPQHTLLHSHTASKHWRVECLQWGNYSCFFRRMLWPAKSNLRVEHAVNEEQSIDPGVGSADLKSTQWIHLSTGAVTWVGAGKTWVV